MDKFVFNGDWRFEIDLPVLSKINDKHWYGSNPNHPTNLKLQSGKVTIEIVDRRDDDPDPEQVQLNTIEYIKSNEKALVESLIDHLNRVVNPAYYSYCGDEELLKKILNLEDLGQAVRMSEIQILDSEKDGLAYFAFMMEYIGDYEHGLVLTYCKDKMLGFAGSCEVDYEAINKDMGGISEKEYQRNVDRNSYGENMIHVPNPKYGKLKPWKLEETGSQLSRLLKNEANNQSIIEMINAGDLDVDIPIDSYWGSGLMSLAVYHSNFQMVEHLLKKGQAIGENIHRYTGRHFDKDKLQKMIELGGNIDELHNRTNITSLMVEINSYFILHRNYIRSRTPKPAEDYKLKQSEDQIRTYIKLGADPTNCNEKGEDCISIIKNARSNYQDDLKTIAKLDAIIFPNKIFKPSTIKKPTKPNFPKVVEPIIQKGKKSFWDFLKFWK
tara:strand:+ start:515 stop:1834 length:1320 start_codon:yes stop_codon:yes gene_type:complete